MLFQKLAQELWEIGKVLADLTLMIQGQTSLQKKQCGAYEIQWDFK